MLEADKGRFPVRQCDNFLMAAGRSREQEDSETFDGGGRAVPGLSETDFNERLLEEVTHS